MGAVGTLIVVLLVFAAAVTAIGRDARFDAPAAIVGIAAIGLGMVVLARYLRERLK